MRTGLNVAIPPDVEVDDVENGRPQASPLLAMDTPLPARSGVPAATASPTGRNSRSMADGRPEGGLISNELLSMKLDLVLQQLGSTPLPSPLQAASQPQRPPRQLPTHLDAEMSPAELSAI